jgi:metal-sulfur cluster biosynthetic enzyme
MDEEKEKLIWEVETTHPELVENIKESLREVADPEIGLNVIELGLIRDVQIEDNKAHVVMILTTPYCPYGPALIEMTRQRVELALQMPTTIEIGMQMWDLSMMEEGAGADWGLF